MNSSFRKALARVAKRHKAKDDREYLKRWAADDYPDDPIWQKLEIAAREHGELAWLPPDGIYESIIEDALDCRMVAEHAGSGIDVVLEHNRRHYQRHLDLAKKAEDLAEYYKWAETYSGIASFFSRFWMPVSELEAFHRKEAEFLRRRAGRPPKPSVRISRQDKLKDRKGLRKRNAFIDLANGCMQSSISAQPQYAAIALLTEIAFPEYSGIGPSDVYQALRPTTRVGREQVRALKPKES